MKIDWKGIIVGTINSIFIKEKVEEVAKQRLEICSGCEFDSEVRRARGAVIKRPDHFCNRCGCDLVLKTRYMAANCGLERWNERYGTEYPLKWTAVATEEEEEEINKIAGIK